MNSMCKIIAEKMATVFDAESIKDWKFSYDTPECCSVRAPGLLITFNKDHRDPIVTFSLTYLDVEEEHKEPLYGHIISRMFDGPTWDNDALDDSPDIAQQVEKTVKNFFNLLRSIKEKNISPQDLFYFQTGYNTAYTDYASGFWS